MKSTGVVFLGAVAILVLGSGTALAQPAAGTYRPPVSPYLNLARPGSPGINYYGLVRPQQEFRNGLQQLQQQSNNQPQVTGSQPEDLVTGHGSHYMNFSHYFGGQGLATGNAIRPTLVPPTRLPTGPAGGVVLPRR